MCDLVVNVSQYPDFLPWCSSGLVRPSDADGSYVAEIGMGFANINQVFATRNRLEYPHKLQMDLESGPFRKLQGTWQFLPIEGEAQACRVQLDLSYDFHPMLAAVVGPVFDKIANTMVESFIQRAERVYG